MKISFLAIAFISLFACTNHSKKDKSGKSRSTIQIPSETNSPGRGESASSNPDLELKIDLIDAETRKISSFYDWTEVTTLDIWGTTGIGKASYFYLKNELKRVVFTPEKEISQHYYTFIFQKGKPIFAELTVEAEPGETVNTSFNFSGETKRSSNIVIPSNNAAMEDRIATIAYTMNFYFEKGKIFHTEVVRGTSTRTRSVDTAKETKRLLQELKVLMESENK